MTIAAAPAPDALLHRLQAIVGQAHVLTDAHDLAPFLTDWRGRYHGQALCAVLPASTQEVSQVVAACAEAGATVVPQGGNTGLVGASVPPSAPEPVTVVIGLRRMNRILDVDVAGNTMTVEAGCILQTIQEEAQRHGKLYGVSLGAEGSCQIGGNIATNAGGTGVIRYGSTRENVLGLEVVLPDGRIWDGLRSLRKDNAGYALRHLFIGAEGTLGIVTRATLRLFAQPRAWSAAWLAVNDMDAVLSCLSLLQTLAGERLTTFELLNRAQLQIVQQHIPDIRIPADPDAPYALFVELTDSFEGANLDDLLQHGLSSLFEQGLLRDAALAANGAQRDTFWRIRHGISESNRSHGMGLSTDVAVPVASVGAFIDAASAAVTAVYPQAGIVLVAHMGDGNVHFIPMFSFEDWNALPDPSAVAEDVRRRIHDVANAYQGTFSAEHGIGSVLTGELTRLRSPLELELMARIKHALDPRGQQNPGKILR